MIYLIITTSLQNKFWANYPERRVQEYKTGIAETLRHLPSSIQPIIVENNGKQKSFLEHFEHAGKPVPVIYTNTNASNESKGYKELQDIQEAICEYGIQDEDMVIKITGRYYATSPRFFEEVIEEENNYDALMKMYDVVNRKEDEDQVVLGFYAMRARYLLSWVPRSIDVYPSAEIAFARYNLRSVSRVKQVPTLDLFCVFADSGATLSL
jgi:hypothetical protein